jgi:hypothetical protein
MINSPLAVLSIGPVEAESKEVGELTLIPWKAGNIFCKGAERKTDAVFSPT